MGGQTMKVLVDQGHEFGLSLRTTPPELTQESRDLSRRWFHGFAAPGRIGREFTSGLEIPQRKSLCELARFGQGFPHPRVKAEMESGMNLKHYFHCAPPAGFKLNGPAKYN